MKINHIIINAVLITSAFVYCMDQGRMKVHVVNNNLIPIKTRLETCQPGCTYGNLTTITVGEHDENWFSTAFCESCDYKFIVNTKKMFISINGTSPQNTIALPMMIPWAGRESIFMEGNTTITLTNKATMLELIIKYIATTQK
jgi:hypothetical protein